MDACEAYKQAGEEVPCHENLLGFICSHTNLQLWKPQLYE